MKRILRFAVLLSVLLMSFAFVISASAASYRDGDRMTYVYKDCPAFHDGSYPGETSTSDGANRNNYYLNRLYWYNGYSINMLHMDSSQYPAQYDGKTYFYCIFPWKHYSTSDNYEFFTDPSGQGNITRSAYWDSLSPQQQRLLGIASMFCFPARTPQELGVYTVDDAYAASQCIIWEIISGRRDQNGIVSNFRSSDFERANGLPDCVDNVWYYSNAYMHYAYNENGHYVGEDTAGLPAYRNIAAAISNFGVTASFSNQTLTMNWDAGTGTYRGTFTDTNNVLKDSYLTSTLPSGIQYQKNGNTVTFISSSPITSSVQVTYNKVPPMYQQAPLAVLDVGDGGQQFMCGVANDPKYFSFYIRTDNGTLRIHQSSEDNIVSGFRFYVYGNGVDTVVTTDSSGVCDLPLKAGTYTIRQLDTPSRYIRPAEYTATVNSGQTADVWSTNTLRRKDLVINSGSEDGQVSGLQYRVTGNGVNVTVTTDSSGRAVAPRLPLGTYTVTQINKPARYVQPDSKTIALTSGDTSIRGGAVYYIRNLRSDKYMDVEGASSADGANVSQFQFGGTPNQQWRVNYEDDGYGGYFTFTNMASGKLLCVAASSAAAGADVFQWHDTGESGEHFQIYTNANGSLSFLSECSNGKMAVEVYGGGSDNLDDIRQYTDCRTTNQEWVLEPVSTDLITDGGIYYIHNKNSNKVIDVEGANSADGTNVSQYTEKDTENQQWQVTDVGGNVYSLKNMATGKMLCVAASSSAAGANVFQWGDTGESGQRFQLRVNSNGTYSILSKCSNYKMAVEVSGYSMSNGGNIQQNTDYQAVNQEWIISKAYVNVSFYNNIIKSRVKFVDMCTYYHGYISGAVYGIYKSDGTYTGVDLTSDASQWVYSPLLPYGDYYLKEKIPAEYYALDTVKYPFSITQDGVYVSVTVNNTPNSDVYPVIVQPNAAYRAGTDIIVSCYIHNDSLAERTPDRPLQVVLTASTEDGPFTSQPMQVIVPRFSENLAFFKVSLPSDCTWVTFRVAINPPSGVVETNTSNDSTSATYTVVKNEESETPDTDFEDTPSDFVKPSETAAVPTNGNPSISSAKWTQWVYESGAFNLKHYGVTLGTTHIPYTDVNAFSSYESEGQLHQKSGYGFSLDEKSGLSNYQDNILPDASSYILPQSGNAYFPKFGYSDSFGKYRTLERVSASTLHFAENPHSMRPDGAPDARHVHFTPLWFPDGDYTVKTYIYDCWTPAGMLATSNTLEPIIIEGNMYDDWIINHADKD